LNGIDELTNKIRSEFGFFDLIIANGDSLILAQLIARKMHDSRVVTDPLTYQGKSILILGIEDDIVFQTACEYVSNLTGHTKVRSAVLFCGGTFVDTALHYIPERMKMPWEV
jgi:hypothetical protein